MFTIRRHIELDAGHRVPRHGGHCRNLHGHRYKVTAIVGAEELVPPDAPVPDAGMVLDFGVIKQVLMKAVHEKCDHKLLLWEQDPLVVPWHVYPETPTNPFQILLMEQGLTAGLVLLPCIPTAEELARYWGERIIKTAEETWDSRLKLLGIEVQETPTSTATWTP